MASANTHGSGRSHGSNASVDVRRMIKREQEIMDAARRMRSSARNKTVRSQCDSQISEAARNITYLQQRLQKLTLEASESATDDKGVARLQSQNSKLNGKITRLDLFRWDRPATMGPRIKLMLQQLEYKTSIEQQYERGTRKMIDLYKQTGDRRSQAEAHANLAESTAKMALLKRSKKRYSDMNLAAVIGSDDDEDEKIADSGFAVPNVRRPLTGVLRVFVKQVEEVDHTIAWADQVEMWVTMKVENNSAATARTRASRSSLFEEEFTIAVDKGNEVEFTVYDRSVSASQSSSSSSSSQSSTHSNPVALLWLRISDIAEAIRQKRVERELKQTGWASAAQVQEFNATGKNDAGAPVPTGPPTGTNSELANAHNNANSKSQPDPTKTGPVLAPMNDSKSGSTTLGNGSFTAATHAGGAHAGGAGAVPDGDETVEGWFTLEPAGRVYLRLGFEKTGSNPRKRARVYEGSNDLAKLGRHNAIRKREETQQVHGHEFVLHQAYNIVRCAVCGDFTTSYFQCQECQLTCDRKCFSKIVTKCTALMSQDPDEELNHRIPHHFEPTTNMKAAWCAQCGFILPLASRRNVRKCTECGIITHTNCTKFVPDLCGMSMEMAAQVVNEITSTRIRQATKAAAVNLNTHPKQWQTHTHTHSHTPSQATSSPSHSPHHDTSAKSQATRVGKHSHSPSKSKPPAGGPAASSPFSQPYGTKQPQHAMAPPPPKAAPVRRKQVPGFGPGLIPPPSVPDRDPMPDSPTDSAGDESAYSSSADRISLAQTSSQADSMTKLKLTPESSLDILGSSSTGSSDVPAWQRAQQQQSTQQQQQQPRFDAVAAAANSLVGSGSNGTVRGPYPMTSDSTARVDLAQTRQQDLSKAAIAQPAGGAASRSNVPPQPHVNAGPLPAATPEGSVVKQQPTHRRRRKVGLDDFSFLAVLGKGNFGKVMLAESKHTGQLYAVKVLKKNFIIENREVESTRSEKRVFLIANRERHPFLINLFACFQTENRIYFVMDYVSGGDLMFHIQQKMFGAKRAQFYAAEVLLALKHFHDNDVIYRDLKLDNILLSLDGHIKVADYGLCKENMGYGKTTGTFCGTPDFIAPEILLDQKYGRSVDWWALGVLMYQMLLAKSPFIGNDEDEVYDAILSDEPLYPIHMPRDSVSILQQLLTRDPAKRLGSGPTDAEEIMSHPYFADIDFDAMLNLKVDPPYKPEIDSPTDVRYFERDFTSEMPALTPMNSMLSPEMQEEFRGFSYSLGDSI